MDELLTMRQVCEALQVSSQTAYRLVWSGDLPSLKVGRQRRVKREELLRYIDRKNQVVTC